MLNQRIEFDRRRLEIRRHGTDRRLHTIAVNDKRRSRSERRSMTDRRIYQDRRMAAASFKDIT